MVRGGTGGSNPASSSGESRANLSSSECRRDGRPPHGLRDPYEEDARADRGSSCATCFASCCCVVGVIVPPTPRLAAYVVARIVLVQLSGQTFWEFQFNHIAFRILDMDKAVASL